jgi:NAD(P)-dependent dehydrogenase (short-subunit alcohol dehydrogenase family)
VIQPAIYRSAATEKGCQPWRAARTAVSQSAAEASAISLIFRPVAGATTSMSEFESGVAHFPDVLDPAAWDRLMSVNAKGAFLGTHFVAA